jgi:glyoxylase-like metal-dependent hydrolase (beta-lactamase superfamily II)
MSLTQHGAHLFRLTRFGLFNSYLLRDEDGLTLIDTNMPGSAPAILKAVAGLGLPVKHIVLTHAHGDHVGSLDALHAALPGAEVSISARDARILAGDFSLDADGSQRLLRGDLKVTRTRPDRLLHDGDRIGSLRAIATPGHTPGHFAFVDEQGGSLIAGDAFQTAAGLAVAGQMRLLFPFPALATWDPEAATRSAARLAELNPQRLAVGHGAVLEAPAQAMGAAVRDAHRRQVGVARRAR